jgi:dienelactone hydrolase
VDHLFAEPLLAGDAPPSSDGPFPVVLVAQGNGGDVIDQVVLCEHLASHGLVVATTPSPTLETPLESEEQVGALAERQASDLLAAAAIVADRLPADLRRIGIVGHSFGARAALLIAMREPRVEALVSLDGGIGTATGVESFRAAPSFDAEVTLPPLLHFFERLDSFMEPDFALLESLDFRELKLEPTEGMHHVHFTTYGFASGAFPEIASVTHATPETKHSVLAVQERTASFLLDRLSR